MEEITESIEQFIGELVRMEVTMRGSVSCIVAGRVAGYEATEDAVRVVFDGGHSHTVLPGANIRIEPIDGHRIRRRR